MKPKVVQQPRCRVFCALNAGAVFHHTRRYVQCRVKFFFVLPVNVLVHISIVGRNPGFLHEFARIVFCLIVFCLLTNENFVL